MALKLTLNQPVQLALLRTDAKVYQHEGKAPSHMYSVLLPDGTQEKLFLNPAGAQSISQLNIQPREWFFICRRKTPQGTEFFDLQTSATGQTVRSLPSVPVPQPASVAPEPQPQPIPPQRALTGHTRASSGMASALIAAIDAATLAKQYAASKGIEIDFGPEDVRAIAATLYIAASKEQTAAA